MAGIEEAFEKFVTRVSGREKSKAEESLSKYKSYSEEELLGNIEAKYPNQLQSFSLEDYQLNTMPNYYNQRYDYENQMPIYQDDRYNIPQQELAYGGIASMFRERPGYAEGGIGFKNVSTTPIYSTSDPTDPLGYTGKNYGYLTSEEIQNLYKDNPNKINIFGKDIAPGDLASVLDIFQANSPGSDSRFYIRSLPQEGDPRIMISSTGTSTPTTTEVPTIDPFSGQQLSLQEAISLAEQMTPPTSAAGYTEEGLRKISEDTASRVNATIDSFNAGLYNQPPSPVDQFIAERRFQAEADAAARSGIPFTKTIQDYLPNIGFNVPGHMDYFNQIREAGLPTSEYHRLGTADLVQRNIDQLPSILKPIAGALAPVTAFASSIPYELTQASQRMQPGSGIGGFYNAYMNESPLSAASNRFIGAAQPLANQIQNLLSPLASSAQRSQQEAAARVTPRMTMAYGGLTNTIPPVKGPDSQGVESLFRRRYN